RGPRRLRDGRQRRPGPRLDVHDQPPGGGRRRRRDMSKILLVEDEGHIAQGLRFNLENQGYEVVVLDDGKRALDLLDQSKFDLVILDIMLPGADGAEIARARRRQQDWTPILMLTAKDDPKDVIAGIDAGADDYLTKPFDLEELLARVKGLLRRQVWMRAA